MIDIADIRRLNIKSGETLVVQVNGPIRQEALGHLCDAIKGKIPEGVKLMVIDESVSLAVITQDQ